MKTNLCKEFFKLLKRHFPKRHKMSKIFNTNAVKLSHSCCRNISSNISSNNRRIVNPSPTNYGCNCRNRSNCPLGNKCLTPSIGYSAIVSAIYIYMCLCLCMFVLFLTRYVAFLFNTICLRVVVNGF